MHCTNSGLYWPIPPSMHALHYFWNTSATERENQLSFTIGAPLSPFHWHIIHCSTSIRFISAPASPPTNLRHLSRQLLSATHTKRWESPLYLKRASPFWRGFKAATTGRLFSQPRTTCTIDKGSTARTSL